jgi:hypothetical protein
MTELPSTLTVQRAELLHHQYHQTLQMRPKFANILQTGSFAKEHYALMKRYRDGAIIDPNKHTLLREVRTSNLQFLGVLGVMASVRRIVQSTRWEKLYLTDEFTQKQLRDGTRLRVEIVWDFQDLDVECRWSGVAAPSAISRDGAWKLTPTGQAGLKRALHATIARCSG